MTETVVNSCSKCLEVKPLISGRTICRECNLKRKRAVAARQYENDPEMMRQRSRNWRSNNPERAKEINRIGNAKFYEANREKITAKARATDRAKRDDQEVTKHRRKISAMTPDERKVRNKILNSQCKKRLHRLNPVPVLIASARTRALAFAVPFDSSIRIDADKAWKKGICEISGMSFVIGEKRGPFAMSLDRIDPVKGYVSGNVRFVCWWLNAACGSWGLDAILPAMRAIVERY